MLELIPKASSGQIFPQDGFISVSHYGHLSHRYSVFKPSKTKDNFSLTEALQKERLCNIPEETFSMPYHSDLETTLFRPRADSLDVTEVHFLLLVLCGHGA